MNFAQEMMDYAAPVWNQFMTHPFIQGMIDGTLEQDKFAWYLMQDCQYLKDYAKVYATAFIKTNDIELMRSIYRDMSVILSDESMTHIRYLKDMGYTENDAYAAPTAPENREYLDYMLEVAREGTMQEGLVSLMACAFSYYHIALYAKSEAEKRGSLEGNYYAGWIDGYSGPGYRGIYDSTMALCARITEGASEQEKKRLKEIFYRSSEYELGFWDMAIRGAGQPEDTHA